MPLSIAQCDGDQSISVQSLVAVGIFLNLGLSALTSTVSGLKSFFKVYAQPSLHLAYLIISRMVSTGHHSLQSRPDFPGSLCRQNLDYILGILSILL